MDFDLFTVLLLLKKTSFAQINFWIDEGMKKSTQRFDRIIKALEMAEIQATERIGFDVDDRFMCVTPKFNVGITILFMHIFFNYDQISTQT